MSTRTHSLSIETAAAEIQALINASPRSPRLEEIAAIIARATAPAAPAAGSCEASPRPSDFRAALDALKAEGHAINTDERTAGLPFDHPLIKEEEVHLADLQDRLSALAEAAWGTRARDPDDLVLLAEFAFLYAKGDLEDFPSLNPGEDDYPRDHALAHLVRGIVDVAGGSAAAVSDREAPAGAGGVGRHAALLAAWREAVANEAAAMEASNGGPPDADQLRAYHKALEHMRHLARNAWAFPVSGVGDLRPHAEIVKHCLWSCGEGPERFEAILAGEEVKGGLQVSHFDERAVAELVRAVLWMPAAPSKRSAG